MGEHTDKKPPISDDGSYKKKWNKKKRYITNRPPTLRPEKFVGGKDEIDCNYFDCTGYGQSDRFVKTVQKIANYIGQEYKGGGATRTEVITQRAVTIPLPRRPVGRSVTATGGTITISPTDPLDISDYQSKKIAYYQIQNQTENHQKVLSLAWQQCTESMHAKIKAHREYQAIEQALNGIELLRVIKLICFNIEDEKYVPQKVHETTKEAFYALKQGKDLDQAYQIKFINTVPVIKQCSASLGEDPMTRTMVCKDLNYSTGTTVATEIAEITKTVRGYTLGAALILGAGPKRYSSLIRGVKNASLAGRDEWPKNVTEAP
jgi:hypothetical protein